MDISIVASQADTNLVESGINESEHSEEVVNSQNVSPDPPNVDLPNMSVDPRTYPLIFQVVNILLASTIHLCKHS